MNHEKNFKRFAFGISLISFVTLGFQVSLSYEFAFMFWVNVSITAISIAMFGLGVGGVLGYFIAKRKLIEYYRGLFIASIAFGVGILLSIFLIALNSSNFDEESFRNVTTLSLISAFPFVFAGMILSMGLNYPSADKRVISYIYFADLIGAGVGSLALTLLLPLTSLETILLCLALVAICSSLLLKKSSAREVGIVAVIVVASIAVYAVFPASFVPSPSQGKSLSRLRDRGANVIDTRWTSVSRVDLVENPDKSHIRFLVNGSYQVPVTRGIIHSPADARDPRNVMFYKNPETMVAIGSGGGVDLAMGLSAGVDEITAVEINPFIVDTMKGRLAEYSNHIYDNPKIKTVIEDGRTYVHRSTRKFDLIENASIGTNALVVPSSTVLTFQDAYLWTVEANRDYFRHLTDDGVAVTIIYGLFDPYNAIDPQRGVTYHLLRQYSTVYRALELEGLDPPKHIMIMRYLQPTRNLQAGAAQAEYTFIFKRPLRPEDVEELIEAGKRFNLTPLFAPYLDASLNFEKLSRSIPPDRSVEYTTDDKPFFYHTESQTPKILKTMLIQLGILTFVFIILPVMIDRRFRLEHRASPLLILYFLCLGLAFILIEAVIIQKLTLFLGRPAYAFQVVLFSMLVFSGFGSFMTGRFIRSNERLVRNTQILLAVLTVLIFVWSFAFSSFIYGFMHFGIIPKIILSIAFISIVAFFMGMPFPLGLRITSSLGKDDVIWMYGVNGAGSVIGSLIGMIIAFQYGFSYSILSGGGLYLASLVFMLLIGRSLKKQSPA